jgi:carbon monoxide dehydrogenase subunit G
MKVEIKVDGIKEALALCDPKKFRLAVNSALNKTADQGKTEASKQIRSEYNIKAGDVSKNMKVTTRASGDQMEAVISGFKRGMALAYFGAKQIGVVANKKTFRYTRRSKGGRGGNVSVEVKNGARKILGGDPKPFLTVFKSGHIAIVERTGKRRLPIKEVLGPGIALLFGSRRIMNATEKLINEKFDSNFKHELFYRLKK